MTHEVYEVTIRDGINYVSLTTCTQVDIAVKDLDNFDDVLVTEQGTVDDNEEDITSFDMIDNPANYRQGNKGKMSNQKCKKSKENKTLKYGHDGGYEEGKFMDETELEKSNYAGLYSKLSIDNDDKREKSKAIKKKRVHKSGNVDEIENFDETENVDETIETSYDTEDYDNTDDIEAWNDKSNVCYNDGFVNDDTEKIVNVDYESNMIVIKKEVVFSETDEVVDYIPRNSANRTDIKSLPRNAKKEVMSTFESSRKTNNVNRRNSEDAMNSKNRKLRKTKATNDLREEETGRMKSAREQPIRKPMHYCFCCNKSYMWPGDLCRHKRIVHGKRIKYTNEESNQEQNEQTDNDNECEESQEIWYKIGKLKDGTVRRYKMAQCLYCKQSFGYSSLQRHINHIHLRIIKYTCDLCGEGLLSRIQFKEHQQRKHKIGVKCFQCEQCNYKTNFMVNLKRHMGVHMMHLGMSKMNGANMCDLCGKLFASALSLRAHVLSIHENPNAFTCSECGKGFSQKGNLKAHVQSHGRAKTTREAKYQCTSCSKAFRWPGDLTRHNKLVHKGIKNYVCEKCGKKFGSRSALDQHKHSHSELRPFECMGCHKCYKSKKDLNQHSVNTCKKEKLHADI